MSISAILVSVAIALSVTIAESVSEQREKNKTKGIAATELPPMQTIFNDVTLLEQTLREHGLPVAVISEDQLVCQAGSIRLNYQRQTGGGPFWVTVHGIQNMDGFLAEMQCFEQEYKQNVQSYIYNRLMESIAERNMRVVEETVLEDNSILLTIDIDA